MVIMVIMVSMDNLLRSMHGVRGRRIVVGAVLALATASTAQAGGDCVAPPTCPSDLDGSGSVGTSDLSILLAAWGPTTTGCGDLDGDGNVGPIDLAILLRTWGPCPDECPITLLVDTNRDNVVNGDDEAGKDKWTRDRGAFFLVNCDDDDKNGKADAAEYDRDEHVVIIDDVINTGDTSDITPLVVSAVPDLTNHEVYLKIGSLDQIRAIHVFEKIAEGTAKFWGGPTETDVEFDITPYLSETDPTTLGIEGLKYRLQAGGVAGFTADMLFDGFVQFEIECRDAKTGAVLGSDDVLLKVAPWIALPNTLDAEQVFAKTMSALIPAFDAAAGWIVVPTPNDKFLEDLESGLGAGQPKTFATDTQWAQDDVEIGFSRTPRSEVRIAAYTRHHGSGEDIVAKIGDALWRRALLMGATPVAPNVGIYRNPMSAGANSGDYGGNIELVPPTATDPLGRICVGNTISAKKKQFFASQEVQPPFEVNTSWLAVGHVDEVVTFWKGAPMTVIIASPRLAYETLGFGGGFAAPPPFKPRGPSDAPPDWATFFSIGEIGHGIAEGGSPNTIVDLDANFLSPPIPWRFVRIYDGTGAGQIAHIVAIPDSHTLALDTVWDSFAMTDPIQAIPADNAAAAELNSIAYATDVGPTWHRGVVPDRSSSYVVVEDTHWWEAPSSPLAGLVFPLNKTPATITRKEFDPTVAGSRGERMKTLNIEAQKKVDLIRVGIKVVSGAATTFLEVPVLYTGKLDATDKIVDRTAVAWTPGAANILVANGKLFVAAQKGPRFRPVGGVETKPFDDVIKTALGAGNVIFVEDFDHYHVLSGEVHCGTNVLRKTYPFLWWEKQPAGVPDLP